MTTSHTGGWGVERSGIERSEMERSGRGAPPPLRGMRSVGNGRDDCSRDAVRCATPRDIHGWLLDARSWIRCYHTAPPRRSVRVLQVLCVWCEYNRHDVPVTSVVGVNITGSVISTVINTPDLNGTCTLKVDAVVNTGTSVCTITLRYW